MARRVTIIGFIILALVVALLVISFIPQARLRANQEASRNNLRILAQFAAHHTSPDPTRDAARLPTEIPPGTILLPDVLPEDRLSWVVQVLPLLDQKRQNTTELFHQIDQASSWMAEANQRAGRKPIVGLICPENPPVVHPDDAAITCYVGIGGVGADAATLPPGSPRSGAFRYDGPTPFAEVTDGLSQTLLFAETRHEVGPWLRGGPSTVRTLDDRPEAPALVGGQFGGYFPIGMQAALCDGSVRLFTPQTSPRVLLGFATIAGKDSDLPPD